MTAAIAHNASSPPFSAETLDKSRAFCREMTKHQAKNFYYGLKLLPEPKRSAMYALYAYMRLVDDIADDDAGEQSLAQRKEALDQWESLTYQAIGAGPNVEVPRGHILWPAFADLARTYRIPAKVFEDMISGQRQDLEPVAIPDFQALYDYCYRVASVVGVASLYVWGFEGGEETLKLGVARGVAFQLTNILRDLREDSARGRCYLPADELERFGVGPDQIAKGKTSREFRDLMAFQIERTENFYRQSAPLENLVKADSRPTLRAMTAIYHGLLEKIAARPDHTLKRRVRLSTFAKLRIGWNAMHQR